jgi:hypothetical protein
MVLDNLRGVVQIIRERYRGALGQSVRGERLSAGKLRHDVDEREGESPQVLLGRVRSQVHGKLALQYPKVEVEDLVTLRGAGLQSAQL